MKIVSFKATSLLMWHVPVEGSLFLNTVQWWHILLRSIFLFLPFSFFTPLSVSQQQFLFVGESASSLWSSHFFFFSPVRLNSSLVTYGCRAQDVSLLDCSMLLCPPALIVAPAKVLNAFRCIHAEAIQKTFFRLWMFFFFWYCYAPPVACLVLSCYQVGGCARSGTEKVSHPKSVFHLFVK